MNLLRVLSRELASKQLLRQGDSLKTTMLHFVELARCSASGATNSSSIRRVISSRTRRNTASFFSRVPGAAAGSSNPQCKNFDRKRVQGFRFDSSTERLKLVASDVTKISFGHLASG